MRFQTEEVVSVFRVKAERSDSEASGVEHCNTCMGALTVSLRQMHHQLLLSVILHKFCSAAMCDWYQVVV